MQTQRYPLLLMIATLLLPSGAAAVPIFTGSVTIAGNSTDFGPLNGAPNSANVNRLGGFVSDLYYDRLQNIYYGLVDRGPGGGTIGYDTRVQTFSLDVDSGTGGISGFNLLSTTLFKQANGTYFNGFRPDLDPSNGNKAVLGRSFDPEGFAIGKFGTYFVSDEYGPSVREFRQDGTLLREFTTPSNLIPKEAGDVNNFADGRPTIIGGRQDNRGFEGLTISPDGTKLYAIFQDPLVNEGSSDDGRRSRNLRLVEFDIATGTSTKQLIYPLEDRADINARIDGTADDFSATNQGRSIGVSSITALNDHEFLVIERDNRGLGVEDATGARPVGTKRVYKIDITGATDVSATSLAGNNSLPVGVTPVSKTLYLDIQAALLAAGLPIPEKIEGLTIGPRLANGSFTVLLGTDNDFSVTQNGDGVQFDVCSDGTLVDLDGDCLVAAALLPTFLYAFVDAELDFTEPLRVPEPSTLPLLIIGMAYFIQRWRKSTR